MNNQDIISKFKEAKNESQIQKLCDEFKLQRNQVVIGDLKESNIDVRVVTGDVSVHSDAKLPKLETVGGDVYINSDGKFPKLETVGGNVYIYSDAKLPKLETVGGDVSVHLNAKLEAPKLEVVGRYVYVNSDAKLEAPKLEVVGGYVSVHLNAKLEAPKLEVVGGYVYVNSDAKLEAPKLEVVGGYVYVNSDAKLPKLENVGGFVRVHSDAKLEAPKLKTVGGNVRVDSGAKLEAPKLENVGGNVRVHSDAKLEAPKLENVGGNVRVHSDAKLEAPTKLRTNELSARKKAKTALDSKLKEKALVLVDNILSHLVRKRGNVLVTRRIGSQKIEYIVKDGEFSAHGATLAEARADLKFKIGSRDTSQFKKWNLETKISLEDAILSYRSITGACSSGVRNFCENRDFPKKLTVKYIIKETEGHFGHSLFKNFFKPM